MLADIPVVLILLGLAAYVVLAGADYGAGFWTIVSGGGRADHAETRRHARHAIGPVWEANHVWLIFVLVVCWTAYPVAFSSIASTLAIPLFVAALGIILRGTAYALRAQLDDTPRHGAVVEELFGLSSILTPFALGTVIGAIASGRVPVGNARGDLVSSWLNPTSITIGVLSVVAGAYLAAVYLAADARRLAEQTLEADFRVRALVSGVVAGAIALAGLVVVRHDARPIWHGLTHGSGAVAVAVSAVAGLATIVLVWRKSFEAARLTAALAVAAILAGWALAQEPRFLPGLTIKQAAAGHETLVALLIGVAAGSVVLVPSLALLFTLFVRGRLDPVADTPPFVPALSSVPSRRRAVGVIALGSAVLGAIVLVFVDNPWAHGVGVATLFVCAVSTFALANTTTIDEPA